VLGYRLARDQGFRSTHFDICANDLAQGRSLALQHGYRDEVELVAGDYHSLPFKDGTFDLVFISAAIHHTQTPEVVIAEAMRVLRDGGVFYCQREPASREFCFYQFTCNRQASYTAFERHLDARQMLRIISSPFPGARNAHLFGRIENDRIALDDYYRAFEPWGTVLEEVLYHDGLLTPLDKEILSRVHAGEGDLAAFIERRLTEEIELARPLLSARDALLGYSLPSPEQVTTLAKRTARSLAALPKDRTCREWKVGMAKIFGASLRFVVRRDGGSVRVGGNSHMRSLVREGNVLTDAQVRERSGIEFWRPSLPNLQDPSTSGWETIFPIDAWDHKMVQAKVGDGARTVRHITSRRRSCPLIIDVPHKSLLAIRARCILLESQLLATCELRHADGRILSRNIFPQTEDQAILAVLPSGRNEHLLQISDNTQTEVPSDTLLKILVCQLLPLAE